MAVLFSDLAKLKLQCDTTHQKISLGQLPSLFVMSATDITYRIAELLHLAFSRRPGTLTAAAAAADNNNKHQTIDKQAATMV